MARTYSIEPHGKKFATICRTDGFWSITWLSKNKRTAKRKGEEFVSGVRTSMRKYVTAYGEQCNTEKSRMVRVSPMMSGTKPMTKAQFAAMIASLLAPPTGTDR